MTQFCEVHINGQHTFFVNEKVVSKYSEELKKIINQHKRKSQTKKIYIKIDNFPGGPNGFELVSRFCYNNGKITITVSNISLLHCCAAFLGMTESIASNNLLQQTETFLGKIFYGKWNDILLSLKKCESFYSYADSSGLLQKLICALLAKIAELSDINQLITTPTLYPSSSSSPETNSLTRSSSSSITTPETLNKSCSSSKAWWFDDLTVLPPKIMEKVVQSLGAYGTDNNNLTLTRFLLHYLKTATHTPNLKTEYTGLAETATYGVIFVGKKAFSCRGLFWVLRIVSNFGLNRDCKVGLEKLIGGMLEQATLDDLLVPSHDRGVYDVNLVLRLIRVFVENNDGPDGVCLQKLMQVGRSIDKYLSEISPDQNLKITKFLGLAESLPDSSRDCFDGVYRAIDIYLESHPTLPFDERSRLCRCLNFQKLSLEASKDLAKNPRIPPRIAVQALLSQQSKIPTNQFVVERINLDSFSEEKEDMTENLQRMKWRVVELEKLCREMKGKMSRLFGHNVLNTTARTRVLPRILLTDLQICFFFNCKVFSM
ncbi:BTB/POZ domain-containing protein family [Quillaja saponaria]|uniref:BTB/POZ domain-containing protein family n=1 Tax=Quillaja saponaria TaxID=32244 RepID=A0AAD7LAL2_QUISA|nr:BTB/POZ domain-containing protein family [Quillaja saponaria]